MTEPLRTDPPHAGPLSEADREARIEQLLLSGLDHYFAGKYEQAINVWTRVAFLERGHGRARAYIERARGAVAERQRESEELLHTGVAAYHAGDFESARRLLTRAVDEGGPNETALVFLERLGRLEAVSEPPTDASARVPQPHPHRIRTDGAGTRWLATMAVSALLAAAILVGALPLASWLSEIPVEAPVAPPAPAEPLPALRPSELRVAQARQLYATGRLREALRVLETIAIADPLRADADRLRADVQRDLLATVSPRVSSSGEARP
jgi:tetratricopeptide (TPR) repeat protein